MAVTTRIFRTYRAPRQVMRSLLAGGQREDRAIAYLMAACLLIFVGQWPRLQREAMTGEQGLDSLIAGALMGWVLVMPLVAYGLAAASHLVARLLGGRGSFWSARLALFWTMLAVSPLMMLYGLVGGFIGESPALTATGVVFWVAFGGLWIISLIEAEKAPAP